MRSATSPSELNISAMEANGEDQDTTTGELADRYYTSKEYKKLTTEQQDTLREKRKARGHNGNSRPNKKPKRQSADSLQTEMNRISRRVAKLTTAYAQSLDEPESAEDESDEEVPMKKKNRHNKSLTRQQHKD